MKNDPKTGKNQEAAKSPMSKASGNSNEARPDVDDTKRRPEPGSKGKSESQRSPKQENL